MTIPVETVTDVVSAIDLTSGDHEHPLVFLADKLGGVEYPPTPSSRWVGLVFSLAPCTLLVIPSMIWPQIASLLLTFAGAFASIQLATPMAEWSSHLQAHLNEAREQRQAPVDLARAKYRHWRRPMFFNLVRGEVGYSPAELKRAQRQFRGLARRWNRFFDDVNERVFLAPGDEVSPAALYRGDESSFQWTPVWDFTIRGSTVKRRIFRLLVWLVRWPLWKLLYKIDHSRLVISFRNWRAERLLRDVAIALIRATRETQADRSVAMVAKRSGLSYERPQIPEDWVFH